MFWVFVSVCFLVLIGGISFWASRRSSPQKPDGGVQERSATLTDVGFDTPVVFQATCSEMDYIKYLDIVIQTFTECNELFDQYNAYEGVNNIYTLNHEAAAKSIEVDPRIIDCIQMSMDTHAINEKFDIAQGRLLSLWHDVRESDNPQVPDASTIEAAKKDAGVEGVSVDGNTISFQDDSIQLDLGAIAKGYTAGLCKDALEEAGLDNGFLNAGGNVVLIGHKTDGSDWRVGIQNPDANTSLVRYTTDTPTCLVTSGDYQRYVDIDGKRYAHIIDPETGYPAEYVRSVTVIDPNSAWADAMSTALFCMSVKDGLAVCQQQDLQAVWFADKGKVTDVTPAFTTEQFDVFITDGLQDSISLVE